MFTIGLPDLKGALGLSYDEGAWLSTASTASQIMIAPAVAWLATAFGLRRVLGIPSLLYALVLAQLSARFASHGAAVAPARALGTLSATVQREANTLAYIDGFWLTVWFAIAGLALVALIGRAPPGPFTPTSSWLPFRIRRGVTR